MDEPRHGGDEVTKEDETVMDADQGSSMFVHSIGMEEKNHTSLLRCDTQCSHTSYHNCDQAPT